MPKLPDLKPFTDEQLVQLINDCEREQKRRRMELQERGKALIIEIATEHNIDLAKIDFIPKKRKPKYINPSTHQVWSGVGKKPKWLEEALAAGSKLEDFEIHKHVKP